MKNFGIFLLSVFLFFWIVIVPIFSEMTYLEQNEIGFAYNVTSGKPVNEKNNPLLDFGFHWTWGYNAYFFVINSEVNSYNFTMDEDANSPFNEALSYDSKGGVTMLQNHTILGRVTNPWNFYTNNGKQEYSYNDVEGVKDSRIYEAIRTAGQFVDVRMGELCENADADSIRKNPRTFMRLLTEETARYCEKFGFTTTDVIFPDAVKFSGDSTIFKGRALLRNMNSRFAKLKKAVINAEEQRKKSINQAKKAANKTLAQYKRNANQLNIEATALAGQFANLIKHVGIDGAMRMKMSELEAKLFNKGVVRKVWLNEKSAIGEPFYNK